MIDFNYTAPELLPLRIYEVLSAPNEPHRIGGVVYVPEDGGECEMYRDEYGVWHCSSCEKGADKITGNDGALESWNDSWPPNFCPYCGGKAVNR